jgi:lysophospholipase L1-like esterase
MKTIKYIGLCLLTLAFIACETDDAIDTGNNPLPALTAGSVDFSTYVAVGASFTAGVSDNGLFIASQENSFPNIMSQQFTKIGGAEFKQPLVSDNTGGINVGGIAASGYRLVFGGAGPISLDDFLASQGLPVPPITTEAGINIGSDFNNFGIPGAKSFDLTTPGFAGFNPYYARVASAPTSTVLADAVAQNPTFFTLSEIGGNDLLGFATSGGDGSDPITDVGTFTTALNDLVSGLTANNAKGAIANLPDITSLSNFTTVPHNPLDPSNPAFGPLIPTLNTIYGALNGVFDFLQSQGLTAAAGRNVVFVTDAASAVVIVDENLADLSAQITGVLLQNPTFPDFLAQFGIPAVAAPTVAGLLGTTYGQARQATEADLLVLRSSSVIGTVNTTVAGGLAQLGLSPTVAGQFAVEGVTLPLEDKWVLIPSEQAELASATSTFNTIINDVASANGLALVDLNSVLEEASLMGVQFDGFVLNTDLVFGGLISLDGVHLTARGYALMANYFLEAIDATYGSNFMVSGNLAKASDFPTNYSPLLQ